jgi:DNA-binding transcriptional LysR family regulator
MYDPVTLDQLRAFVAVVDEGSFSAAARKLQRVQSAVSTSMANLEAQLGVSIWDRTTKVATLTEQGRALLASAQRVLGEVDALRKLTAEMVQGLEASVSLCVDALFPPDVLIELCAAFAKELPTVDLRLDIQVMSAVSARVVQGAATLGIASPGGIAAGLERRALSAIRMVPVVSPRHPLAAMKGKIPQKHFADAIQIVLSERGESGTDDRGVLSPRTWRVADLHTKHMMLAAGLGWGNLPEHLIREDIARRKLVVIEPESWGKDEHTLYFSAVHRSDTTFGPAHRWLLANLERLCHRDGLEARPTAPAKKHAGRSRRPSPR